MSSFFSQGQTSDQQDLEDNAKGRDLYVSIVVNNKMELFAKACRWAQPETSKVLTKGKYISYTGQLPEYKVVQDCKVSIDMQNPEWFTKRLSEVKPASVPVNTGWKGNQVEWYNQPKTLAQQTEFNFHNTNYAQVEEEDYTLEDELIFLFNLPKKCVPELYLQKNKIDKEYFLEKIAEYGTKAEDAFFNQLAEWVIENDLQESPFFNQITQITAHVEQ